MIGVVLTLGPYPGPLRQACTHRSASECEASLLMLQCRLEVLMTEIRCVSDFPGETWHEESAKDGTQFFE
jgi:hypothetical protein